MKKLLFPLLALPSLMLAQSPLKADVEVVNMGEVMFQHPKTATFQLKNTGTSPLTIAEVHPSCGCTSVEWPKESIASGANATIKATFDAQQLGTFQKEIEVWTDTAEEPIYLMIQGRVVTMASDYDGDYPIDLGSVRLNTNIIEFDDVHVGEHPEAVLQIVNTGRNSYKPQIMHLPSYLKARYQPEQLAGGREGRIVLTLNGERLKSYGLTQTSIYLARNLGDKVSPENEISVSVVLIPAFSHLTAEQRRTAPRLVLSKDSLDFSAMKTKKKATQTIIIGNAGERPLHISRMQISNKVMTVKLSDRVIKPGKRVKLKVTLNPAELQKSKTAPRVLLITDDPENPKKVIKVKK